MTDTPQEPPDETGSPRSEADEGDRGPDDRTADPDLGQQDAAQVSRQPQNPVEPDDPDVAT
jgi:hypothetical protein